MERLKNAIVFGYDSYSVLIFDPLMDFLGKNFVTHIEEGKSKNIGILFNGLTYRSSCPMASISLNAYQNRVASGLLFLEFCSKFKAMCRNHSVIMIARGN